MRMNRSVRMAQRAREEPPLPYMDMAASAISGSFPNRSSPAAAAPAASCLEPAPASLSTSSAHAPGWRRACPAISLLASVALPSRSSISTTADTIRPMPTPSPSSRGPPLSRPPILPTSDSNKREAGPALARPRFPALRGTRGGCAWGLARPSRCLRSASVSHSAIMACPYASQSTPPLLNISNARPMAARLLAGSGKVQSRHSAHFPTATGPASRWLPFRYERSSLPTIAPAIWPYILDASTRSPDLSNSPADFITPSRSTYATRSRSMETSATASRNASSTFFP